MFPLKEQGTACPDPRTPPPFSKSNAVDQSACKRRSTFCEAPQSMGRASVRRLARRAGVKRIGTEFYSDAEASLRRFLGTIVKDAAVVTEHARRRTVTLGDILLVLKRNGRTLYGFEERQRRRRLVQRLPSYALADSARRLAQAIPSTPAPASSAREAERPVVDPPTAPQEAQAQAAPPAPKPAEPQTPAPLTPERAQEIQLCLSAYRDTVLERAALSCSPLGQALAWVASELASKGRQPCSAQEFEVVLDALDRREAIMLDGERDTPTRTLYFL